MIFVASSLLKSPVWGSPCALLERRSSVVTPTTYSSLVVSVASREYPSYIPQFPSACEEKYLKNNMASTWHQYTLRYLFLDNIYSSKLTIFLELRSQNLLRFSKETITTDKYSSTFTWRLLLEAIVYFMFTFYTSPCRISY